MKILHQGNHDRGLALLLQQQIWMGCENSNTASSPLPPSSNPNKISIAPTKTDPEPSHQLLSPKNQLISFDDQSATAPPPVNTLTKQHSSREKSYVDKSNKKLPIISNETVEEKQQVEVKEQELKITSAKQLTTAMMNQMKSKEIYSSIIDVNYICSILEEIGLSYIRKHKAEDILHVLTSYIQQSRRQDNDDKALQVYAKHIGQQLYRIKEETAKFNINSIKMLQYLRPQANADYAQSFLNFKFDLSIQELEQVIATVKTMLRSDERSTFFIPLYLQISTNRLQKSLIPVIQIEKKLSACLEIIENSTIQLQHQSSLTFPTFPKQTYNKRIIDFKTASQDTKVQKVESFAMTCAAESQTIYGILRDILWKAGLQWGKGIEMAIFDKSDRAMVEIMRSIADVQMQKVNIETTAKEIEELTIEDLYFLEHLTYRQQLKEIFAFIDSAIEFKTYLLLQARLYFHHATHIQEYLQLLNLQLKNANHILMEVINRLTNSSLSEVLLRVNINGVAAEVHLILLSNYHQQFYNKFVHTLADNRNFTCCSHLKMIGDTCLPQFLGEMKELIKVNLRHKTIGKVQISAISQHFSQLQSLLPFSLPNKSILQANSLLLQEGIAFLTNIRKDKKSSLFKEVNQLSKLARMVQVKRIMKDSSAENQQNEFYASFEQKELSILELRLQRNEQLQQADLQLLKRYVQHVKQAGLNLLNKDFYEKAQKKFETFIRLSNYFGGPLMITEGKRCLALLEYKKGNFNRALQILEKCFSTVEKYGSSIDQLEFIDNMAKVYIDQERYEIALNLYDKYLKILNTSNEGNHLKTFEKIGNLYYRMQSWEKAVSIFEECLQIQEVKSGFDSYQCTQYLMKIAETYSQLGQKEKSLEKAQKCLKIVQSSPEMEDASEKEMKAHKLISNLERESGNYDTAIQHLLTNLQMIQKNTGKLNIQYCDTLQQIGNIHEIALNYQQSLVYYEHSLAIRQRIDNKNESGLLELIGRIAKMYQKLNNTAKSMKYQAKMDRIGAREKETHSKDHVNTFLSIAKKSLDRGNYPLSLKYYRKSLLILEELKGKDSAECIPLMKSMGLAYKFQGHLEQSIRYFSDCLTLLQKHKGKNNIEAAESYYQIGNIYDTTNSFDLAQTYYSAAIQLCQKYNVKYSVFANANFGLANVYFRQSMYSKAFECYERSLPLLEKLYPKLYLQAIQNMDACDREIEQQFPRTAEEDAEQK